VVTPTASNAWAIRAVRVSFIMCLLH
jgi:hypothetical protein